ncbi:hypothetical protein SADUNF_Sadunf19G0093800 [Salix dunnii]|uniref:CLAVATA3/ESR-related protein n=1 Tax=Salix dunnii TaxID=1413687 RepID=A0A835J233_9ROSI|nr:hypothetical protein SADUNF_Sadunf19G0093800 [Salix dunnii]
MATIPPATRVLAVLLVVFLMLMRFEAAPIHTLQQHDKRLLLSKVLNSKSRMEFRGRWMSMSESATDRLSPEGPNPEHHSLPPWNKRLNSQSY